MRSLLLVIVLCRALSCACFVLLGTEQAAEKETQLDEKKHSNTFSEMRKCRSDVPGVSEYTLDPDVARWGNRTVTYRISKYTEKMPRADVDKIVKKAFETWSNVSCVTFKQVWDAADIDIMFAAGVHGTGESPDCPFDGESAVLAHAYSSFTDGNEAYIHLDEDENWTKESITFPVILHEAGHVLGLLHSDLKEAVMYKVYNKNSRRLHQDDIEAIQALYGKPGNCSNWPRYPAPPSEMPSEERRFLDAASTFQGQLLFFKGDTLTVMDSEGEIRSETKIKEVWPILSCGIDAAYEVEGILYVFSDLRYWTVSGNLTNLSSSQSIYTMGFPEKVDNIDAAVYDHETRKTLLFVEDEYWRYNEETESMEEGYPRKIAADFPEIGSKVDAAYQDNGSLYLYSGLIKYEFDCKTYRLIDTKEYRNWFL